MDGGRVVFKVGVEKVRRKAEVVGKIGPEMVQ